MGSNMMVGETIARSGDSVITTQPSEAFRKEWRMGSQSSFHFFFDLCPEKGLGKLGAT